MQREQTRAQQSFHRNLLLVIRRQRVSERGATRLRDDAFAARGRRAPGPETQKPDSRNTKQLGRK